MSAEVAKDEFEIAAELAARDGFADLVPEILAHRGGPKIKGLGTKGLGAGATFIDPELTHPKFVERKAQLQKTLDAAKAALRDANRVIDAQRGRVDSGAYSGWVTAVKQAATVQIPQLERTIDQAANEEDYAYKWLATAEGVHSQLSHVWQDRNNGGSATLQEFEVSIVESAEWLRKTATGVLGPITDAAPWLIGIGLLLLAFAYLPGFASGTGRAARNILEPEGA